jgi:predicted nucleotidyltransferase
MFDKDLIKSVIYEVIPAELIARIMVFGSRARGDATPDSDTDICVLFKDEIEHKDRYGYRAALNKIFARRYLMPTDIIMKSDRDYNRCKVVVGALEYDIAKDGVSI